MTNEEKLAKLQESLAPWESISRDRCPICGGILIDNYGPEICATFCIECDYTDYDYG